MRACHTETTEKSKIKKQKSKLSIVRVIARLNAGGPARHVVWLTSGLESEDFHTLLVAGTVPPGEEDMSYFATENGVEPFYISEMSREISLKDGITIWKLYCLLRRERPDIVHTHTAKAGTVGRIAALLYRWLTPSTLLGQPRRCLLVHTYHGHIFHSYYGAIKTSLFLLIEKLLARFTDRIIVVSEQQREEISQRFKVGRPLQFSVVPLGLDLTRFSYGERRRSSFRDELGARDDEVLIGIVGRLTEIKNHELFLNAIPHLKHQKIPARRFLIIGEGALRANLEAQAQSLGLTDEVVFVGSRKDPENFYPALDVVALTSRNEGTPLTLIEAMANGRAVIATSVGGVVDLLGQTRSEQDGYEICERGILVGPNDAEGFAKGLSQLICDENLRHEIAANGLQFVHQNFARERLLEDIGSLYKDLMASGKTAVVSCAASKSMESRV